MAAATIASVQRVVAESRFRRALLAIALIGLVLSLASAVAWFTSRQDASFWLGIAALAVVTVASLTVAGKTGDWLSPLVLSAIFYLLAYVGGGVYFWYHPDAPHGNTALTVGHVELTAAVWLAVVAWVMFAAGYAARPFRFLLAILPPPPAATRRESPWWVVVALLIVGWPARLHQVATGRYFHISLSELQSTSSSWLVSVASELPLLATAFLGAWTWHACRRGVAAPPRGIFWALVVVETLWHLPTGARGDLVGLALMLVVVSYYGRGIFPVRAAAVGALVIVFVVFPLVQVYRGSEAGAADTYQVAPQRHLSDAVRQTFTHTSVRMAVDNGLDATFWRFSDVVSLGFIGAPDAPGSGRKPGETLLWSVQAFVPRAILHDKIDPAKYGNEFGRRFGFLSPANYTISVAVSQPGDLYLNFGWLGVVLLMPLIGGIFRLIGDYLHARTRDPTVLAVYAVVSWPLISIHENIVSMGLPWVLKLLFVYVVVLAGVMAVAPSRRTGRSPREVASGRTPA